jgi:hypothetical protein
VVRKMRIADDAEAAVGEVRDASVPACGRDDGCPRVVL